MELPTGGAIEYDWDAGATGGQASGVICELSNDMHIYRRVVERRVYADGATLESRMTYSRPESRTANCTYSNAGYVEVSQYNAGGALQARSRHFYHGSPTESLIDSFDPTAYSWWKDGKEYRTEELHTDGATVLRKVERAWQQRAPVSWWASGPEPANDPRQVETVTTLADTGQVAKSTAINPLDGSVGFDQYNNPTDLWEYDYGPGTPGPFLRRTHTDYVTTAAYVGANVDPSLGAHLRSLPSQKSVSSDPAGAGKVSRTDYEYDNYGADQRHAALTPRPQITGLCLTLGAGGSCAKASDANYQPRGNVTGVTSYADAAGQTGPVIASTQYDVAGNAVKSINSNGKATTLGYTDSFCNGTMCGGSYTANTFAFASSVTSPVPDISGQYASATALTGSTVYDFHTGLAYSATDANAKLTTFEYNDALDRPTRVNRPDGGWTKHFYDRNAFGEYVNTQTLQNAAGVIESSYQFFDGLGRPYRSFAYENQDPANPWITTDTEYDALGRVRRVSLPYRTAGSPSPLTYAGGKWAETAYDALGRAATVTTKPDNAVVTTVYIGNTVTVIDQAGKKRRSVSDALGRLVRVDEPDDAGNLDTGSGPVQPTSYAYDAVGNLRRVEQGSQLRYFAYDSLGRLIRAKNPEQGNLTTDDDFLALTDLSSGVANSQWSLAYKYDANGNLIKRKDARGVVAVYAYDALNRNTTVGTRTACSASRITRRTSTGITIIRRAARTGSDVSTTSTGTRRTTRAFDTHLAVDHTMPWAARRTTANTSSRTAWRAPPSRSSAPTTSPGTS